MGLSLGGNCLSSPYRSCDNVNPDPENFIILSEHQVNGNLILIVKYPRCINFEGTKILVYENIKSSNEILKNNEGKLDPHFSENNISPIARFKPTSKYFYLAIKL